MALNAFNDAKEEYKLNKTRAALIHLHNTRSTLRTELMELSEDVRECFKEDLKAWGIGRIPRKRKKATAPAKAVDCKGLRFGV